MKCSVLGLFTLAMNQMLTINKYLMLYRWKEELQEELQLNNKQTESLKKCLTRLKKALIKTDEPLKVSSECQHYRQSRTGVDKIEDEVRIKVLYL